MPSYKTKAVVLKTYNLAEADKIVKLFSGDYGIIDSVAKGARKIRSKFLGKTELFNFLELELSTGKSLDIITQLEVIKSFSNIPKDFNKFIFCQFISDIVLKSHLKSTETTQTQPIFRLIYVCFNEINNENNFFELQKISAFFISKFLKILGYVPDLTNCSLCKKILNLNEVDSFSIKFGGVLCSRCSNKTESNLESKIKISTSKYIFLNYLFTKDLKFLKAFSLDKDNIQSVFKILQDYLKFHLEINVDISSYLKTIVGY